MKKIYLAIPYSGFENESFLCANRVAGKLMSENNIVYSPISHTHPIASQCHLPGDWAYWERFQTTFIEWCDELYIAKFKNWRKSKGVTAEISIAIKLGKPVYFMED